MTIQQNTTYVPPALRAAKPKHAATRNLTAKRFAGGAILSAAIAGGALRRRTARRSGRSGRGSTGTAQAAPCATGRFLCQAAEGGAELFGGGDGSLFGAGVGATADLPRHFDALDPLNLIGPGGLLIGNGLDADRPHCSGATCDGGNGGLLFGNGGKGADATATHAAGKGGNAGLIGNGGVGGDASRNRQHIGCGQRQHGHRQHRRCRRQRRLADRLGRCRRPRRRRHELTTTHRRRRRRRR